MEPTRPESPEYIHHVLRSLKNREGEYLGGVDVDDAISMKTMTAVTGPSAAGISIITAEVLKQDDEMHAMNTTTTRPHHDGDPAGFQTNITYGDFNNAVIDARFVNFNIIGQDAYGTYPEGFVGRHNIGAITAGAIPQMLSYHWQRFNAAFIVVGEDEYDDRLRTMRMHVPNFLDRGFESLKSLRFAERNIEADWLHIVESAATTGPSKTASKVISIARGNTVEIMQTERSLEYIRSMVRALKRVMGDVQ